VVAEFLQHNWGLLVAALLLVIVAVLVLMSVFRHSAGGRLRARRREYRARVADRNRARQRVGALEKRVAAMRGRRDSIAPRKLEEAEGRLSDARALLGIADDRVLVAANLLRQVIVEEFPPARHEALRERYLPDDATIDKPFTF